MFYYLLAFWLLAVILVFVVCSFVGLVDCLCLRAVVLFRSGLWLYLVISGCFWWLLFDWLLGMELFRINWFVCCF